jgi:hypothetical protein
MPFTLLNAYTPSGGPVAAAAAPGSIPGWTDVSGNQWSINASNQLRQALTSGAPWNNALLLRPDVAQDARIRTQFVAGSASANNTLWAIARATRSAVPATNGYGGGVNGDGTIQFFKFISGSSATQIGVSSTSPGAFPVGNTYHFEFSVVQTNATTTTLTGTVYAADGVTVRTTYTLTDTTAALQNVSGQMGVFQYQASVGTSAQIVGVSTFTGDVAATPAANVTLSGPTATSVGAGVVYDVALDGAVSADVVVTPTPRANVVFDPTSVTLNNGNPSASFLATPSTAGTYSIVTTNNGGLTNGSAISLVASASSTSVIPVDSAAFLFSPGNWRGDTGRGGSAWRRAWGNGAFFHVRWQAGSNPTAVLNLPATSTGCKLHMTLNGVVTDGVAATGPITLSGIVPNAINTLTVTLKDSPQIARWGGGVNTVRVLGLSVDNGSSAGLADAAKPWVYIAGDSLTEGISTWSGGSSSIASYAYQLRRALSAAGYDLCVDACGYSGFNKNGDSSGDVPGLYRVTSGTYDDTMSRWNKVDNGVSRLDANGRLSSYGDTGTEPAAIITNMGTNEALTSMSTADLQAACNKFIISARAAAPNAVIIILVPFGFRYATKYNVSYANALIAAVNAYKSANPSDQRVTLVDVTASTSASLQTGPNVAADGTHWTTQGQAVAAAHAIQGVMAALQLLANPFVSTLTASDLISVTSATGVVSQMRADTLKSALAALI